MPLSGKYYKFIHFLLLFIISGCTATKVHREIINPSYLRNFQKYGKDIKIHMKDGSLYLASSITQSDNPDTVLCYGLLFNQNRDVTGLNVDSEGNKVADAFHIPFSGIALMELNSVDGVKGKPLALALISAPTIILTSYCLANPKACFGSCPTFYLPGNGDTTLFAEGFSSSILPAFEKEDIDLLDKPVSGTDLHLILKNEAIETHVIKYTDLLAFPARADSKVFFDGSGEFTEVADLKSPAQCTAPEGNCLQQIAEMDKDERFSPANRHNLAAKETIDLVFNDVPGGSPGLIINCRQTLLTTWIFYQSLALLGTKAGYFAARIESGDELLKRKVDNVWDKLGGIEVFVSDGVSGWKKVGEIEEMGPIASDYHLVKLPAVKNSTVQVRLRMTQGLWRINYVALGKTGENVAPVTLKPSDVSALNGKDVEKQEVRFDENNPLVTLPGDAYDIHFFLPQSSAYYQVFLKTKGYYIEWMRDSWVREENLKKAALFFGFPGIFMRTAAGEFKKNEPGMEKTFWNSKYERKN